MITRRNVLQLAAASAVAVPAASGLTRAQAARALDTPTSPDMVEVEADRLDRSAMATDPATFAQETMRWSWTDDLGNDSPKEAVAFFKAREAFLDLYPELRTVGPLHPFEQMSNALYALWNTAHMQGVRAGAAAEHYRQVVVGPLQLCHTCWGVGVVKNAACHGCNGHGTLPASVRQGRSRI